MTTRVPAGVPTGGQFAADARGRSAVELERDASDASGRAVPFDPMHVVHVLPANEFAERFRPGEYIDDWSAEGDASDWDLVANSDTFLVTNPLNPDRVSYDSWGAFAADIAANGVREPVTIDWYDPDTVTGGHHRIVAAIATGQDVPFVCETETRSYDSFDELPENAQQAIRHQSPAADHENAEHFHRIRGYRYEIERVPMADMRHRIFTLGADMVDDFGTFEAYHDWYCAGGIPDHGDSRWPVIEAPPSLDPSVEYLEDGWHRFHSYVRAGDSHVEVLRVLTDTGAQQTATVDERAPSGPHTSQS